MITVTLADIVYIIVLSSTGVSDKDLMVEEFVESSKVVDLLKRATGLFQELVARDNSFTKSTWYVN